MFYSFQELADLKKADMKSFRNIIVDERNILVWQGLIVPVSSVLFSKGFQTISIWQYKKMHKNCKYLS